MNLGSMFKELFSEATKNEKVGRLKFWLLYSLDNDYKMLYLTH